MLVLGVVVVSRDGCPGFVSLGLNRSSVVDLACVLYFYLSARVEDGLIGEIQLQYLEGHGKADWSISKNSCNVNRSLVC